MSIIFFQYFFTRCIPNRGIIWEIGFPNGEIIKSHVLLDEGIAGSEPNTVSLRREIAVLDENDNPPVYHGRPYAARVPESAHVGGLLVPPGTITITDRDGGVNADVHVECVSASRDDDVCDVFNVSTEKVESCSKIELRNSVNIIILQFLLHFLRHTLVILNYSYFLRSLNFSNRFSRKNLLIKKKKKYFKIIFNSWYSSYFSYFICVKLYV